MKTILAAPLALLIALPALAGEGMFMRTYTTETVPAGHYEFEQLLRNRSGRAFGTYEAIDSSTEIEYGVTDNLQAALYFNTGYVHAVDAPDDDSLVDGQTSYSRTRAFIDSVSAEFIYRFLSPVSDPVGVALYIEPAILFHDHHNGLNYDTSFETEYKLLVQKNLLDDQLIIAYNIVAEIEFIRFQGDTDNWKGELDFNNNLGVTYRVAPNIYAGLEIFNHNEIGNFDFHEHSVYWIGPVAHYGGPKFWATLGFFKQFYGVPNGTDENGTLIGSNNLFLRSHENWEVNAKVGIPF